MKKYLIFSLVLLQCAAYGQTIKRQVIGSMGTQHRPIPGTNFVTAATVAQPPNAGTITTGSNCLRQGFQQPPNDNSCPISISYTLTTDTVPGCGTYYVFEYTGDITPTTNISWDFGIEASPFTATGVVSPNVAFYEKGNQEVIITVSNGDCSRTITTIVNAQTAPYHVQVQMQHPYCYGDPGVINLIPTNGTPPYKVEWSNGAVTEDLLDIAPGLYAYTVTDQRGCSAKDALTLKGSDQPLIIKTTLLDELCHDNNDGSIELDIVNGALPVTFKWEDGSSEATRTSLDAGEYKVTIVDAYGCRIDTVFKVRTFCDLHEEDFISDTFSPNGDALNETWEIPILERFPENVVTIFNRWGSLIWQSKGPFQGWMGTNQAGEQLPIGAYYFLIELNDATKRVFKGSITMIK
jgi:gliding motility-associated-like protein